MNWLFKTFWGRAVTGAVLAILAGGGGYYFGRSTEPSYETVPARRMNIIQEVDVTGRVTPAESVELAFEKSGRVAWIRAQVGERVPAGHGLVGLEASAIEAELAEAALKSSRAKLDELRRGTRPETLAVQEAKVQDARENLRDKIEDAYTKSDDAVRNKVDQFITNPRSAPQLNFAMADPGLESAIETERLALESRFNSWLRDVTGLSTSGELGPLAAKGRENLAVVKSFLDRVSLAINSLKTITGLSQTTIDSYRSDVATARTNAATAINNLSQAENDFLIEERELALERAGATAEELSAEEAEVEKAEAKVAALRAELAKATLYSPIAGIVTKQDAKIGEIVSSASALVAIISEAEFEIEANIPEVDITKVKIGDPASVTLDAYGGDVRFEARVTAVDPAATIIEGVPTYKTTLQFTAADPRVRSGMTADVTILTAERKGVVAIPQRAVIAQNGQKLVRVLREGMVQETKVKTGLRGSDGNVEIIEGIAEGEEIILSGEVE